MLSASVYIYVPLLYIYLLTKYSNIIINVKYHAHMHARGNVIILTRNSNKNFDSENLGILHEPIPELSVFILMFDTITLRVQRW